MKKLFLIVAVLIIASFLAVLIVPYFIHLNQYKATISKLISEKIGMDVAINGDISVSILPHLGITLHDIDVSGDMVSEQLTHLQYKGEDVLITMQLWPLFKKQLAFERIILRKPDITLQLSDKKSSNKQNKASADSKIAASGEEVGASGFYMVAGALSFNEFNIDQGTIQLQGGAFEKTVMIKDLMFQSSMDDGQVPFKLQGALHKDNVKHEVSSEGKVKLNDKIYVLDQTSFSFGKTKGYVQAQVDTSKSVPHINTLINIETLDLNQFMPDEKAENKWMNWLIQSAHAQVGAEDQFTWSRESLPLDALRGKNVTANIVVKKILYRELALTDTSINANLRNSLLKLETKTQFAGGSLMQQSSVDAQKASAFVKHHFIVDDIQLSELPKQMKIGDVVTGKLNMDMDVSSVGNSQAQLIGQLSGKGKVSIEEGKIKGIDLQDIVKTGSSAAFKQIGKDQDASTEFDQADATFQIRQGILSNQDLRLVTKPLSFSGSGTVDLPRLWVDYRVIATSDSKTLQKNNLSLDVPILVRGSVMKPAISIDVKQSVEEFIKDPNKAKDLIKNLKGVKGDLKGQRKEMRENLKDNLQDNLQHLLQGL